ncbi:MAG: hypothetical protein VX938_04230, partial [Myxococcota bacterium]|nr:hypothetical protein [Myxococcota bacterium]
MERIALGGILGLLALYVFRPIWDIDLFWHIAAGRHFLETGGIPTTDIFSPIDPQKTWVTFQWGYQVLVHLLEELGGLDLIRGAHAAVMWGAFALFAYHCRRSLRMGPTATVLLVALVVVLFGDRIRVRPHVFNLLGWVVLLPLLLRGSATTEAVGLRSRPIVFSVEAHLLTAVTLAIWANLHAGGAFLFLVAAATVPFSAIVTSWAGHP